MDAENENGRRLNSNEIDQDLWVLWISWTLVMMTDWVCAYDLRATEARGHDKARQVRRGKARRSKCGPIRFGPQFIAEPCPRKCIGRFE